MEKKTKMKPRIHKGNRFELQFYEGYKGRETPAAVLIGNRKFIIDRILERKRVLDKGSGKKSDVFTCLMEGQRVKIVVQESGEFELIYL
jgi:hypothetical protein